MDGLTQEQITSFLRSMHPFSLFDEDAIKHIALLLKVVHIERGKILMRQNDPGHSLYFVFGGHFITTVTKDDGAETPIGEIGQGEIVGEIALIVGEPRTATVRAIRDSILLEFTRHSFDYFSRAYPSVAMSIARFCVRRLIGKKPFKRNKVTTVALIPAGENPYFSEFVEQFSSALSTAGSTLHLSNKKFEELYRPVAQPETDHGIASESWLYEQEDKYQYIVYESDDHLSQWSSRCLKHADRIIFVGLFNQSPALNEIEKAFAQNIDLSYTTTELVLLHRSGADSPKNTNAWLEPRKIDDHHHVKIESRKDYEKLVRFFTGNALGLVLGGGGMRGFAYIGLLRALEELRIEFDIVGGCSLGAGISAYHAMGFDSEKIHTEINKFIKSYHSTFKFTFPILSLMSGNTLRSEIYRSLGNTRIEDLWTKYFCVSTNLSKGHLETHTRGSICHHVLTSMAVPGLLPPTVNPNGDLCVDGGIISNIPINAMRQQIGNGTIIAAGLTTRVKPKYQPIQRGTSGWTLLFERIFRAKKYTNKLPNIAEVIILSMTLAGTRSNTLERKEADHFIELNVGDFKLLQTEGVEELINACYLSCLQQLEKIFSK